MGQRSATETRTPRTTERPFGCPEITERIPGRSVRGIHADPRPFEPLGQLTDVDLILLGRVSLLRILLSVISGHPKGRSVVPRSSYFPESSPRLGVPARPCGRGRLAQFSLPQRFAVLWVALPWPILPVPAVPLALCRVVEYRRPARRDRVPFGLSQSGGRCQAVASGGRSWEVVASGARIVASGTRTVARSQRFPEEPKYLQDKDLRVHYFAKKSLSWYAPNMRP